MAAQPTPSPLKGRRVALVHPAWHSCGTYRVVLGQIAAYRALGAEVFPIADQQRSGFCAREALDMAGIHRRDAGTR